MVREKEKEKEMVLMSDLYHDRFQRHGGMPERDRGQVQHAGS